MLICIYSKIVFDGFEIRICKNNEGLTLFANEIFVISNNYPRFKINNEILFEEKQGVQKILDDLVCAGKYLEAVFYFFSTNMK